MLIEVFSVLSMFLKFLHGCVGGRGGGGNRLAK